ncbi:hypothetical protein [Autumnicola musiva]|uniref:Uncharacterized protein n=1 Tax=Autumnicola musiva TaxID=3075589 RepID=A0ABU3D634_9FLAO|nr:hypothetical protein [Zunongwangia sp. F117]MDT0676995.1 hypothetical protein [Zunongwangia sp. F117]
MNVPANVMKIRLDRASELTRYAQLLEKFGIANTFPLHDAAQKLRDKTQAFHKPKTTDYSCWGYDIEGLTLYLPTTGRHIHPNTITSLEITIDTKILCDHQIWNTFSDPFIQMNFRTVVRGIDSTGNYSFGFHIDRHDESIETDEIHPIYHIQYLPRTDPSSQSGQVLLMDTPRMMHMPVDIILGVDLVLANFSPEIWHKMRDESEYHTIFKKYQESFWRPYIHTFANNWAFNNGNISWDGKHKICPNLSE